MPSECVPQLQRQNTDTNSPTLTLHISLPLPHATFYPAAMASLPAAANPKRPAAHMAPPPGDGNPECDDPDVVAKQRRKAGSPDAAIPAVGAR